MLTIQFLVPGYKLVKQFNQNRSVRMDESALFFVDQGETAIYERGLWRLGTARYAVMQVSSPVCLYFQNRDNRSRLFGPYAPTLVADGTLRAGGASGEVIAEFIEEFNGWRTSGTDDLWPTLVLMEPPSNP